MPRENRFFDLFAQHAHTSVKGADALLAGGRRIVHTMGSRITRLNPMQGFCAETGGASTLFLATWLGVPVSTTHTITGAIVGVGTARRTPAVRWGAASTIRRLGDAAARRCGDRSGLLRTDGAVRLIGQTDSQRSTCVSSMVTRGPASTT